MRLTDFAMSDPAGFARFVGELRKLGVTKLGALSLGPEPAQTAAVARPQTIEDVQRRVEAARQARHRTLFAASTVAPHLSGHSAPSVVPRAVRAMRHAHERPVSE